MCECRKHLRSIIDERRSKFISLVSLHSLCGRDHFPIANRVRQASLTHKTKRVAHFVAFAHLTRSSAELNTFKYLVRKFTDSDTTSSLMCSRNLCDALISQVALILRNFSGFTLAEETLAVTLPCGGLVSLFEACCSCDAAVEVASAPEVEYATRICPPVATAAVYLCLMATCPETVG